MDLESMNIEEMTGIKIGTPKFTSYKEAKEGDVLVAGIYRGDYPNKFNSDRPNHKFECQGREIIVLPAAGQLDYLIKEQINVGDLVRVYFEGKEEMPSGVYKGKPVNKFSIELLKAGEPLTSTPVLGEVEAKPSKETSLDDLE